MGTPRWMVPGTPLVPTMADNLAAEQQQHGLQHVSKKGHRIRLLVKDQLEEWKVTLLKTEPLSKLKDMYCSRRGLQASEVHFTANGELIAADGTAEDLGLADKDSIGVVVAKGTSGKQYEPG